MDRAPLSAIVSVLLVTAYVAQDADPDRGAAPFLAATTVAETHTRRLAIGAIVAAQYIADGDRFVLYATEPVDGLHAEIWIDEVVQLVRAAMEVGPDFGFSLDFERTGRRRFEADDILDVRPFGEESPGSTHPIVQLVRRRMAHLSITPAVAGSRGERSVRQRIASALNQLLTEPLESHVSGDEISHEVAALLPGADQRPRVRRLILEDLFGQALRRDRPQRYLIRYKPAGAHAHLARILSHSRSEAVLLAGDALLKSLGTGDGVPGGILFGSTQLSLCTQEYVATVKVQEDFTLRAHVDYFDFELRNVRAIGFDGSAIGFRDPRLIVRSDGAPGQEPLACEKSFAASLTRHLPGLLRDRGQAGQTLRNLQAFLTLNRALGWLLGHADPDLEFIRSIRTDRVPSTPPSVRSYSIRFVGSSAPVGIAISGGIQVRSGAFRHVAGSPQSATSRPMRAEPTFVVTPVDVTGKPLLSIDLSTILGN